MSPDSTRYDLTKLVKKANDYLRFHPTTPISELMTLYNNAKECIVLFQSQLQKDRVFNPSGDEHFAHFYMNLGKLLTHIGSSVTSNKRRYLEQAHEYKIISLNYSNSPPHSGFVYLSAAHDSENVFGIIPKNHPNQLLWLENWYNERDAAAKILTADYPFDAAICYNSLCKAINIKINKQLIGQHQGLDLVIRSRTEAIRLLKRSDKQNKEECIATTYGYLGEAYHQLLTLVNSKLDGRYTPKLIQNAIACYTRYLEYFKNIPSEKSTVSKIITQKQSLDVL